MNYSSGFIRMKCNEDSIEIKIIGSESDQSNVSTVELQKIIHSLYNQMEDFYVNPFGDVIGITESKNVLISNNQLYLSVGESYFHPEWSQIPKETYHDIMTSFIVRLLDISYGKTYEIKGSIINVGIVTTTIINGGNSKYPFSLSSYLLEDVRDTSEVYSLYGTYYIVNPKSFIVLSKESICKMNYFVLPKIAHREMIDPKFVIKKYEV